MSQCGRKENKTDVESDKILKINDIYVHHHWSLKSDLKRRVKQLQTRFRILTLMFLDDAEGKTDWIHNAFLWKLICPRKHDMFMIYKIQCWIFFLITDIQFSISWNEVPHTLKFTAVHSKQSQLMDNIFWCSTTEMMIKDIFKDISSVVQPKQRHFWHLFS